MTNETVTLAVRLAAAVANPNLLRLREWAYPKGYEWIRLSPDGDVYDELPTFDW